MKTPDTTDTTDTTGKATRYLSVQSDDFFLEVTDHFSSGARAGLMLARTIQLLDDEYNPISGAVLHVPAKSIYASTAVAPHALSRATDKELRQIGEILATSFLAGYAVGQRVGRGRVTDQLRDLLFGDHTADGGAW